MPAVATAPAAVGHRCASTPAAPTATARLDAAAAALVQDADGSRAWARLLARLPHLSGGNLLLVARQAPGATQLASELAWERQGRQLRPGASAVWIAAPVRRGPTAAASAFRPLALYDVADTEGPSAATPHPLDHLARRPLAQRFTLLGSAVHEVLGLHLILGPAFALGDGVLADHPPNHDLLRVRASLAPEARLAAACSLVSTTLAATALNLDHLAAPWPHDLIPETLTHALGLPAPTADPITAAAGALDPASVRAAFSAIAAATAPLLLALHAAATPGA